MATSLAPVWSEAGHEVVLGSRDPLGSVGVGFPIATLADAVGSADVVVNATPGSESLALLTQLDADLFAGKVLLDVANAVDNDLNLLYPNASLAEAIQVALPDTHVVKSMNTASIAVMADPGLLAPSSVFLSGDNNEAKRVVRSLLGDLGWAEENIVDLGGISTARGPEHCFLLFSAVSQSDTGSIFNIHLVRP
ncbi:MAG: oxidoreductase coenzyme F420-dependent [Glaciihabitans sp.]|nr:oxidoreductase coenzyme F420-dependent [Glaciihabitans sp.]